MDRSVLRENLQDPNCPIGKRYNALFEARSSSADNEQALVDDISNLLMPHTPSILLRHEACYVLGQSGNRLAVPLLEKVANDRQEHEVVRHEAVEGLAALNSVESLAMLYTIREESESGPLRDTCDLAIDRLEKRSSVDHSEFNTVDPIETPPPSPSADFENDVTCLKASLLNADNDLTYRYKCLYLLRSLKESDGKTSADAALALAEVMKEDRSCALLRHELAFVIAQMAFGRPSDKLVSLIADVVDDESEHCMVRHEAAIALGSIGGDSAELRLSNYLCSHNLDEKNQNDAIVFESCQVAIENMKYWKSFEDKVSEEVCD